MGIFSKGRIEQRLAEFDQNLAVSFSKVREDTSLVFQWITYLNAMLQQQQRTIEDLIKAVEKAPSKAELERLKYELIEEMRGEVNSQAFSELALKLAEIEARLANITPKQLPLKPPLNLASNLQEKVVKKVSRGSKEYIKHAIKSLISRYGKISALELRDIIVEEQALCSKSTFYRLLEEIEKEEDIAVVSGKKVKSYMQKIQKLAEK